LGYALSGPHPGAQGERRARQLGGVVNRFNYSARVAAGVACVAVMCLTAVMPCMAQTTGQAISADVLRTPDKASALVSDSQQDTYRKVMSAYAREELAHPADAALVMARCQFAEGFAASEDISWSDDAQADSTSCQKTLEDRFHDDAEAVLFVAEQRYGEPGLAFAKTLLPASDHWTVQQRARLHVVLSRGYQATKQTKLANEEALTSVRLDPGSDQLVPALRYLCDTGRRAEAESLLAKAPAPAYAWKESARVKFALDSLSPAAAIAELQRAEAGKGTIDPWLAANVYLRAGMPVKAAEALGRVKVKPAYQTAEQYRLRLDVAVMQKDGKAASAAIRDWFGKTGMSAPLVFAYGSLLGLQPWQLFSPSLVPLALAILALLVFLACVPGLIAFPAHYRGTVRARLLKLEPPLFAPIGLRHMWLGLGAYLAASTLVPMLWAGTAFQALTGSRPLSAGEETMVVITQLASLGVAALFLLPAARHLLWRAWVGNRGLSTALITISIWGVLSALVLLASMPNAHLAESARSTLHDRSVVALVTAAAHVGGAGLAMLMVAVVVPIYEELMFRGFVLGGLSRHLSFGWSNAWQALLFAALHFDASHFVFYLVLGLVAGWLVRRTGGLAASMALHAVNNAIACAAILLLG
jgi:membrane protease YdiL (CAAX protease family)